MVNLTTTVMLHRQLKTLFALSVYNGSDSLRCATKIVPWV